MMAPSGHTGEMQPEAVEVVRILVDAQGEVTEDEALAVEGEILEKFADGRTRSTLFTLDPSAAEPA